MAGIPHEEVREVYIPPTPADDDPLRAGVRQLAEALAPQLQNVVTATAEAYIADRLAGRSTDLTPTVTAASVDGRSEVVLDARTRSWRTLVQGLSIDVLVAAAVVLGDAAQFDLATQYGWQLLGLSLAKTVVTAAVSYVARLKITPANQK